jgi:hypothetical protein
VDTAVRLGRPCSLWNDYDIEQHEQLRAQWEKRLVTEEDDYDTEEGAEEEAPEKDPEVDPEEGGIKFTNNTGFVERHTAADTYHYTFPRDRRDLAPRSTTRSWGGPCGLRPSPRAVVVWNMKAQGLNWEESTKYLEYKMYVIKK